MDKKVKVLVVMWYDDGIKSYGDAAYEINKKYCNKHGYDIIKSNKRFFDDRHMAWERIPLILKHIKQYDYITWIDADAHFYITAPPLTKLLSLYSNKNFIFSQDDWMSVLRAKVKDGLGEENSLRNLLSSGQLENREFIEYSEHLDLIESRRMDASSQLEFFKKEKIITLDDLIPTGPRFNTKKEIAKREAAWDNLPTPKVDSKTFDKIVEQFGTLQPQIQPNRRFKDMAIELVLNGIIDDQVLFQAFSKYFDTQPYIESINSGIFITKNTSYSIKMLEDWYKTATKDTFDKNPWDQEALNLLYRDNLNNIKENSVIVNYGILQSFPHQFRANSLALHYVGHSAKERVSGMSYYKKLIKNTSIDYKVFKKEIVVFLKKYALEK